MFLALYMAQAGSGGATSDLAVYLGISLFVVAIAYWAHAAQENRSLLIALSIFIGLMLAIELLIGFVVVLLAPATYPPDLAGMEISLGISLVAAALLTPLLFFSAIRRLLARALPIDPNSPPDMLALMAVLQIILVGGTISLTINLPAVANATNPSTASVSPSQLLLQSLPFVIIGFFSVAPFMKRTLGETMERLGLVLPSGRQVAAAVGIALVAILGSALVGIAMSVLQPEAENAVNELMGKLMSQLFTPLGAVAIGLGAGIGEEMLFRGALQPRVGIVLASLSWAILHSQYAFTLVTLYIFVLGIVLGLMRKRWNTTSCIITHATFNTVGVLLSLVGH